MVGPAIIIMNILFYGIGKSQNKYYIKMSNTYVFSTFCLGKKNENTVKPL